MSLTRNIGQYEDIRQVFNLTLANGGGRYTLDTPKAAIRWRQRAYMFRSLLRQENEERRKTHGIASTTPYDGINISLEGPVAVLTLIQMAGRFETLDGTAPVPPTETAPDELELEAQKLRDELGL